MNTEVRPTRNRIVLTCLLALAALSLPATAEPTPRSHRPAPLDPKASVPALTYASSLKLGLRPAAERPISWRDANDTVAMRQRGP